MSAILTLNAGSSSLKFAVYRAAAEPALLVSGQVDRLGGEAELRLKDAHGADAGGDNLGPADHAAALDAILAAAAPHLEGREVTGVGHRIVHGGTDFDAPAELTPQVVDRLAALEPLAPLHQPHNLAGVRAAQAAFPRATQIGCFDTAFHRGHPWVNDAFALPRRFHDEGVRRYGFHGLSYDYVTGEVARRHPALADARLVIAHLGNGASMCAARGRRSIGSSMGFSALDGLPMGTRCGQIDPGVLLYLMDRHGMDADALTELLYRESGLKGMSGISGDMRTLEASDAPEAQAAIDYYTFRIRREIGAMTAVLGGIDALVFCGGVGENSARVRAGAVEGLAYLGLAVDADANARNADAIGAGATPVLVIPTDEERVIARAVAAAVPAS
ncbi:acetate/propionate family kinase [Roseovarius salinarum]|uniref:acetate/propionate family kinase n=1 Tax=Roseovarius salinarum TaxID=1981892 RepID=UPI000C321D81|nr:acetate/propionate family kinase [Roseovarius salinarum]